MLLRIYKNHLFTFGMNSPMFKSLRFCSISSSPFPFPGNKSPYACNYMQVYFALQLTFTFGEKDWARFEYWENSLLKRGAGIDW